VHPAPEQAEHPGGVGGVARLAEQPPVQHDLRVGPEHRGPRRRPPGGAEVGGDREGLGQRDRRDGLVRRAGRVLLGNVAGPDLEGDAETAEQLAPAGRGRGQDEGPRAQVASFS
jgi:hypothetical protein